MFKKSLVFSATAALVLIAAAGCSSSNGGSACAQGSEDCACYPNLTCDGTLACRSMVCVNLDSSASGGHGGAAGASSTTGGSSTAGASSTTGGSSTTGTAGAGGAVDMCDRYYGACLDCQGQYCSAQGTSCVPDDTCMSAFTSVQSCVCPGGVSGTMSISQCLTQYGSQDATTQAITTCMQTNCKSACLL